MADGQNNNGILTATPLGGMPSQAMAPSQGGLTATPLNSVGDSGNTDTTNTGHEADIIPENASDTNGLLGLKSLGKEAVNLIPNALSNFGAGMAQTVSGTVENLIKHPALYGQPYGELVPQEKRDAAANAIQEGMKPYTELSGGPVSKAVGYGGESLMEFLAGDDAIKGLSLAKKLEAMSGITKVLEQSPRTMNATRLGALVGKVLEHAGVSTISASTVAGLQTFLRSGGDFNQALQDALHTAEFAAPLSAATETLGEVATAAGKNAAGYESLQKAAGSAAPKEQVASEMADKLNAAEKQMHNEYETGFQDIASRTEGHTVPADHTPLSQEASRILANQPEPGTNPLVASARKKIGDALNPKVQELLQELSSGSTAEEIEAHENAVAEAARPTRTGILGPGGQEITHAGGAAEPLVPHEYTGKDLVELRQVIRKMSDNFDYGDINSRTLRSLISSYGDQISPMDETLGQLAGQAGDDTLMDDYMRMRKTYMDKHSVFENNKVIDNLREGKVGDAAQGFINMTREGTASPTTGKAAINIRDLRTVLGDEGVHAFGKQVFGTVLRDSQDQIGGQLVVNPDRFLRTLERFDPETLNQLIDWGDVNNGLAALKGDAHAAAVLQKLTRLGVMSGVGTVAGAMPHVGLGTLVGMVAGEGGGMGGIAQGRKMLDWIANNPKIWKMWAGIGKVAESPTAGKVASAVRYGGGKAIDAAVGPPSNDTQKSVYGGLSSSLGGR